jgi:uncharacterized protein (TIGR03067 family)
VKFRAFSLVSAALLATGAAAQPPTEKEDLERLQGTWKCIGGNVNGKTFGESEAATLGMAFAFKGDRLQTIVNGQPTMARSIKLAPHKSPREIDTVDLDPAKPTKGRGIYALDGDMLQICLREDLNGRPGRFAVADGTNDRLWILRKDRPMAFSRSLVTRLLGYAVSPVVRAAVVEGQKK